MQLLRLLFYETTNIGTNYVQPIMASLVAILIGIDHFGYQQALAAVLVFSGVYIVTQSKSRAQLEVEKSKLKNSSL